MGLPMEDNIHAPTVASGPASGVPPRDLSTLSMPDLMQEKERIESELSALSSVLQSVRFPTQRPPVAVPNKTSYFSMECA